VPVPSKESEWSCIRVLGAWIMSRSTILLLDFGTVHTYSVVKAVMVITVLFTTTCAISAFHY